MQSGLCILIFFGSNNNNMTAINRREALVKIAGSAAVMPLLALGSAVVIAQKQEDTTPPNVPVVKFFGMRCVSNLEEIFKDAEDSSYFMNEPWLGVGLAVHQKAIAWLPKERAMDELIWVSSISGGMEQRISFFYGVIKIIRYKTPRSRACINHDVYIDKTPESLTID